MRTALIKISNPRRLSLRLNLLILVIATLNVTGQSAAVTVSKVYRQLQKVKDYKADAKITVSLPFIKIAPMTAQVYIKQPDKFKVQSKSITIIPREGFDQLQKILGDTTAFTAIGQGNEIIEKNTCRVISLLPLQDTSDLILAKLWIDPVRNLVLKSLLTTKSNGTILTEYQYGQYAGFGLPDYMLFTVDIKKFKIPKSIAADIHTNSKKQEGSEKETKKGKIQIALSNYVLNKGLPDALFKK